MNPEKLFLTGIRDFRLCCAFRFALALEFIADDFEYGRKARHYYYEYDEHAEVILNPTDVADEIPGHAKQRNPYNAAQKVVSYEVFVVHAPHTRDKRGEGTHDRYESRQNDGFAAVFGVEVVGLLQIFLFENLGVGIGKQFLAEEFAYFEVYRVAQYRRRRDHAH